MPFANRTTLQEKTARGPSSIFLLLVPAGYLSGLTDKLMAHPDHIACLHAANSLMVLVEVVFYTK